MNNMSVKPINDDKKFSLVIKNIDHNSHRAYKFAKDPKFNSNSILKNQHQILKDSQNMRFPFGSNNIKFRSQCPQNIGEKRELTGNLLVKNNKTVNGNPGSWQSLMGKTQDNQANCLYARHSSIKRFEENKNGERTLNPNRSMDDLSSGLVEKNRKFNIKRANEDNKKMERCGSIQSLFQKTPDIEVKTKLHSGKMIKDSNIFVPDTVPKKRIRSSYEHNLDSKDPLNIKTPEVKQYDLSAQKLDQQRKQTLLTSDIFNRDRGIKIENKKYKGRVNSQDERFNPYKNFQSSIVFE